MTDREPERADVVAALREQATELVQQIPGPLHKLSVAAGDSVVTVEWADPDVAPAAPAAANGAAPTGETPEPQQDSDRVPVTAPLVGTFYRSPEPGADPFVEVGGTVEADQTVGIVEAMKLMNPVKAPQAGTVAAIHVEDGEMVEYGQSLLDLET